MDNSPWNRFGTFSKRLATCDSSTNFECEVLYFLAKWISFFLMQGRLYCLLKRHGLTLKFKKSQIVKPYENMTYRELRITPVYILWSLSSSIYLCMKVVLDSYHITITFSILGRIYYISWNILPASSFQQFLSGTPISQAHLGNCTWIHSQVAHQRCLVFIQQV